MHVYNVYTDELKLRYVIYSSMHSSSKKYSVVGDSLTMDL